MIGFGARAALIEALSSLAGYNDKGYSWSGHDEAKVAAYRAKAMAEIRLLVDRIGRARLPAEFLGSLDSGAVAEDASGQYVEAVRDRS